MEGGGKTEHCDVAAQDILWVNVDVWVMVLRTYSGLIVAFR
jgi:hypothetical protein